MAAGISTSRCSVCEKSAAMCNCTGCKASFCVKHFNEHRQQLSAQFDCDVVKSHDELLEQINQTKQSDQVSKELLTEIDEWERSTIEIVKKTASRARDKLTELLSNEREMFMQQFNSLAKAIRCRREDDEYAEDDIRYFQSRIHQLRRAIHQLNQSKNIKITTSQIGQVEWDRLIDIEKQAAKVCIRSAHIEIDATWNPNAVTIAGSVESGTKSNRLNSPQGICIDNENETIYIADSLNHRIVKWRINAVNGEIVAGGIGAGNRADQLNNPLDVIIDKQTHSLIICDAGNQRVVQWSYQNPCVGKVLISGIDCRGIAMDDERCIYVANFSKNHVERWRIGDTQGTVVAGGNGKGNSLNQLNRPQYVYVDQEHSVYVSDMNNYRVVKWPKGATEGVVVAGGHGKGTSSVQLSSPYGVVVDSLGSVYVVDCGNHQLVRWYCEAKEGNVIVGGNGCGNIPNQLNFPVGLCFDERGNIYISDNGNHRIQRFGINTK